MSLLQNLPSLNPQAKAFLWLVGLIIAIGLVGGGLYRCTGERQVHQQAAEARQQQAGQAAGLAEHTRWLIDSTRIATEREVLLRQLGHRVELPANPPKEQ